MLNLFCVSNQITRIISGCNNISDRGLIGWRLADNHENGEMIISVEHSLLNLKGLTSLALSGCEEITNVSLLTSFKLPELRKLKLGNLKKISELGIEALVQNCRQIEILDCGGCENINDNCIGLLARRLKRIRFLDIHSCKQLTDATWHHLANHSNKLQILNAWSCGLTIFLSDMLFSRIDSLKMVFYEQYARRFEYIRRHKGTL